MKFIAGILAAILCLTSAEAQITLRGSGNITTGGGAPFSGIGDVVSGATAYWGLTAYNAAKATAGVAAINLCNGTSCGDVHVTSAGTLNVSDLAANGCNLIDTCTIATRYDGTGNGYDEMQSNASLRYTFKNHCLNGGTLPCEVASGTVIYSVATPGLTSGCCAYTFITAANRTGNFTTAQTPVYYDVSSSSNFMTLFFNNAANQVGFYSGGAGSAIGTATDNTWHAIMGIGSTTTPTVTVDGTSTGGPNASSSQFPGSGGAFYASDNSTDTFQDYEDAIYQGISFNSTQITNVNSNMHTRGGY